jgi:type IV fimbrial biogenesis protein FimT
MNKTTNKVFNNLKYFTNKQQAFTLIELVITLAIIAILAGISLPSFKSLVGSSKITSEINALNGILQLSRTTAITKSEKVTICPSNDGVQCTKNWSQGYMAFIDFDGNRQLDSTDQLLQLHRIEDKKIRVRWRAFRKNNSLQWLNTGITNHQNGSFEYCYQNEPNLARGLFITKSGRVRLSKDTNGDDIHEDAKGDNIQC